jgi:hypothetical protein
MRHLLRNDIKALPGYLVDADQMQLPYIADETKYNQKRLSSNDYSMAALMLSFCRKQSTFFWTQTNDSANWHTLGGAADGYPCNAIIYYAFRRQLIGTLNCRHYKQNLVHSDNNNAQL